MGNPIFSIKNSNQLQLNLNEPSDEYDQNTPSINKSVDSEIIAESELFTLSREACNFKRVHITDSKSAENYCRNFYGDDLTIYESFFVAFLNRQNQTIGYAKISQGGITGTVVDVRLICFYAIKCLCTAVILCHNHPSGQLKASAADLDITSKLIKALNQFDITVHDHIILTDSSYFSFADEGNL